MKTILHILGCLLLSVTTIQAVPTPADSLKVRQASMTKRIDSLSNDLQRLSLLNDSLNKELYYYRAKDDFYVMAVDRQGSHFEWLLGIALAIAGLFTYGYFQDQIMKLKNEWAKKLKDSISEYGKINADLKKVKVDLYRNIAVIPDIIDTYSQYEANDLNKKLLELKLLLGSIMFAKNAYVSSEEKEDKNKISQDIKKYSERVIDKLQNIKTLFDNLTIEDKNSYKETLNERRLDSMDHLNYLISIQNDTFFSEASEIKNQLYELYTPKRDAPLVTNQTTGDKPPANADGNTVQ